MSRQELGPGRATTRVALELRACVGAVRKPPLRHPF